jgi:acetyl-CoA carboxylase biotin carboxyl carrier protein
MKMLTIRAEVTGTVWKVLAQAGERLEADSPLMVLESMKMEIPVIAPEDGRVIEILVNEGEAVREGQDLARFEES